MCGDAPCIQRAAQGLGLVSNVFGGLVYMYPIYTAALQRTLFLGERAHLFHQAGEPALRAEPGALGAIQRGLIRGGIQFNKRLGF